MDLRLIAKFATMLAARSPVLATEAGANVWLGQFATINATEKGYVRLEAQERQTRSANCYCIRWWLVGSTTAHGSGPLPDAPINMSAFGEPHRCVG
jgi:hypothetical protein